MRIQQRIRGVALAGIALALLLVVLSGGPASAQPDFTNVTDILNGRRHLLRDDHLILGTQLGGGDLVLQRTFTQLIKLCYTTLTMGNVGRAVPLLPVGDDFQHRLGVECTPGQDAAQQHLHLGDRQAWGFFFNLRCARTRKP